MNNLFNKLEKKFGKYAVQHLTFVMIGCYVIGYLLQAVNPEFPVTWLSLDIRQILHGQIWRLVTWVLIPPSSFDIFTLIMLFFYLSIGVSLERAWGDFYYNLYVIGGMILSVIAAFITYALFCAIMPGYAAAIGQWIGYAFSTYYICMSLMLAYAATFPDATVLLMFVIPVKMKVLGYIYGAYIIYDIITLIRNVFSSGLILYWINVIAICASLANFLVFFIAGRHGSHLTRSQRNMRRAFRSAMKGSGPARRTRTVDGTATETPVEPIRPYRHRCEVCGRTDVSDPDLEFRYCSKCDGAHEYCMDHLYTHQHVKASDNGSQNSGH